MAFIYEKVTIDMLRPGVPFYRANPEEHNHNILPDYNVNLVDPPETEVWVCYSQYQKNPFIKKECFATVSGLHAVSGLINSKDSSWF